MTSIKRLNYFKGEFLLPDDLSTEQEYHRQMRRLHNRLLHAWGVAGGGLAVSKAGEKTVEIAAGMAIDKDGNEIVLLSPRSVTISGAANTKLYLTIGYKDSPSDEPGDFQQDTTYPGAKRTVEEPICAAGPNPPPADGSLILLAAIAVDAAANISAIDPSVRPIAGPVPSGAYNVRSFGARADGATDDRNAIQSAIDTAASAGGGVVSLPRGIFAIGSDLFLRSKVWIIGQGCGTTLRAMRAFSRAQENPAIFQADASSKYVTNAAVWDVTTEQEDTSAEIATLATGETPQGILLACHFSRIFAGTRHGIIVPNYMQECIFEEWGFTAEHDKAVWVTGNVNRFTHITVGGQTGTEDVIRVCGTCVDVPSIAAQGNQFQDIIIEGRCLSQKLPFHVMNTSETLIDGYHYEPGNYGHEYALLIEESDKMRLVGHKFLSSGGSKLGLRNSQVWVDELNLTGGKIEIDGFSVFGGGGLDNPHGPPRSHLHIDRWRTTESFRWVSWEFSNGSFSVRERISAPNEIPMLWKKNTPYWVPGCCRGLAGYIYALIVAGTSEDSDRPALLGKTEGEISDGTCKWKYIGTYDQNALPYSASHYEGVNSGHNLLVNPSFEAGLYGWSTSQAPGTVTLYASSVAAGYRLAIGWHAPGTYALYQELPINQGVGVVSFSALVWAPLGQSYVTIYADGCGVNPTANIERCTYASSWMHLGGTIYLPDPGKKNDKLKIGLQFVADKQDEVFGVDECSFSIGAHSSLNQGRFGSIDLTNNTVAFAMAAPDMGTWKRGDVLFNSLPSAGGSVGWVCTTSGNPGTWKKFGMIES